MEDQSTKTDQSHQQLRGKAQKFAMSLKIMHVGMIL